MISPSDRGQAVELIEEAVQNGASLAAACRETGISERTYKRWKAQSVTENSHIDRRTTCERPVPANKLSELEERQILNIAHSEKYASMPPSQIVPSLADEGIYIASESTFYRVLHKYNEQHHRGRSQTPTTRPITTHTATAPNQVYVWDITYLNGPIKGAHYYLYMISDIFSRKIIAWEVWKEESAEHASELIRRAYIAEKLALHIPVRRSRSSGVVRATSPELQIYRKGNNTEMIPRHSEIKEQMAKAIIKKWRLE